MSVDRGFTWMDDETLSLIDIFSTEEIQKELNGSKRNIGIYERIASELSNIGFKRTAYQCREKIKRLRKEYHQVKYCIENNMAPKKQMKYYELVDKLFNHDSPVQSSNMDSSILSSDHEDEIHFTFSHDQGSDASNSCTVKEPFASSSTLQMPPCSPLNSKSSNSPLNFEDKTQDSFCNSEDTLLNGMPNYDLSDQDDTDSLWVPSVVLVENNEEDTSAKDAVQPPEDFEFKEKDHLHDFKASPNETFFKDSEQPPRKQRRKHSSQAWFKEMFDNVTDTFLTYQESAESRFLERITHLEQERMKRDENMHRLWLEFEERRRKEEQQHELKMLSLLGQFFQQVNSNENQNTV